MSVLFRSRILCQSYHCQTRRAIANGRRQMIMDLARQTSWILAWVESQLPKSLLGNRQSLSSGTRSDEPPCHVERGSHVKDIVKE